jgi:hypothetical protein
MRPHDDVAEQDRLNRFWDDLVRDADPRLPAQDDAALDPGLTAKIRRLHRLNDPSAPTPAFRRGLREQLFGREAAIGSAPSTPVDWPAIGPNGRMPHTVVITDRPRVRKPRRWWPPLELAAAALLILGLFGVYVGGHRALPALFGEREDREGGPTLLVHVSFPKELFEVEGTVDETQVWISRLTIVPGGSVSRSARPEKGAWAVEYVVEGTYAVRTNGALSVVRAGEDGDMTGEPVAAGVEVTLHAGDAVVYDDPSGGGAARNAGGIPVVLLAVVMPARPQATSGGPPAIAAGAVTSEDGLVTYEELAAVRPPITLGDRRGPVYEAVWPTPLPDQVGVSLWAATLAPGAVSANPVPGSLATVMVATADAPPLVYGVDGNVTNTASFPVDVVILTIGPFDALMGTPSP